MFGAFFGRNRNTDTIHFKGDQRQKHYNGLAIDGSQTIDAGVDVGDAAVLARHRSNKTIIEHRKNKQRQHIRLDNMIMLPAILRQLFESLAGQLHMIIHAIYMQFPNTIFCWLFHYAVGTVTVHMLLATNS